MLAEGFTPPKKEVTTWKGKASWFYVDNTGGIMTIVATAPGLESGTTEITNLVNFRGGEVFFVEDNGKTKLFFHPGGDFEKNIELKMSILSDDVTAPSGYRYIPGTTKDFRAIDYDSGSQIEIENKVTIYMPYPDEDVDGLIDDIDVPVMINGNTTLRVVHLEDGVWKEHKDWPLIIEEEKRARFDVEHFSIYCLMAKGEELGITKMFNYPNPFSNSTTFKFNLGSDADESEIKIYTVSGRLIKTIEFDGDFGYNEVEWGDGKDENDNQLANGVYLYKITARNDEEKVEKTGKLLIMR